MTDYKEVLLECVVLLMSLLILLDALVTAFSRLPC